MKEWLKGQSRAVGLYGFAHEIWIRRPDLRVCCWNAGYRLVGAGDGLPIPPTRLIYLVDLSKEVAWFLHTGQMDRDSIQYALQKNGFRIEDFQAILDFGCGCGRVMRYWKSLKGPRIYGTDYNRQLIEWSQRNLSRFADFKTNHLAPPLDYEDGRFDLIYALSVFTHLTEDLQRDWMHELVRVLQPNGLLLITLHGENRLYQLEPEEQRRFLSGQLVVKQPAAVGSNLCGTFHPEQYVRSTLAREVEVIDHIPGGERAANQDIYLLRKPV
jgi:SAM-dependent methyltransferase